MVFGRVWLFIPVLEIWYYFVSLSIVWELVLLLNDLLPEFVKWNFLVYMWTHWFQWNKLVFNQFVWAVVITSKQRVNWYFWHFLSSTVSIAFTNINIHYNFGEILEKKLHLKNLTFSEPLLEGCQIMYL